MEILFLLLTLISFQEYGKPEELKGLTKVFVDTGGDMKNRERISKEIETAKLGIELLDSDEGAEIVLDFGGGKSERIKGSITNGTGGIFTRRYDTGTGKVFIFRNGKARIVMSYEGEETHMWENKPATNFGKSFVKAWKKANNIK
jgi:hypothetical protein